MDTIKYFLSCDWGTSSLRLRLAEMDDCRIITEEHSGEGISPTYAAWRDSGLLPEHREAFYLSVIKKYIGKIEAKTGFSLAGIQVIISGMASSSIGFIDIPYSYLHGSMEEENINIDVIPASADFKHNVLVISGIRTDDDVIRGEETQLIGFVDLLQRKITDELFIFPGTHSKHIRVINDRITGFKTYMTGEFFELLSNKSILNNNIEAHDGLHVCSFVQGVNEATRSELLNSAFKVRTNDLLGKLSPKENYNYLSGLLIGTELKHIDAADVRKINLLGGANLQEYYLCALDELGLSAITTAFDSAWVDEAVVRGHHKIYKQSLQYE